MNIFCRICETIDNLLCLLNDPENTQIVEMLTDLANVSYSNDDLLPKFLCQKCQKSLQFAIEFKRQCEMTDQKLRLSLTLLRSEEETANIVDEFHSDCDMLEIEEFDTNAIKIECLEKELNTDGRDTEDTFLLQVKPSEIVDKTKKSSSMQSGALKVVKKNQSAVSVDRRTCVICNIPFESISAMIRHKKQHIDPNLTCFYCDKRFKSFINLEVHIRKKHFSSEKRTFECFDCKKEFKTRQLFKTHYEISHSGNSHVCHLCSKHFLSKGNLKRHLRILNHDGLNIIGRNTEDTILSQLKTSEIVDKTKKSNSMQSGALKVVKKNQSAVSVDRRTCIICNIPFESISALRRHKKQHIDPNLTCFYCGKRFKFNTKLEFHVRKKHCSSEKRTFECFDCKKEFKIRQLLNRHYEISHSGSSHVCHLCSKHFLTKGNLIRHIRLVHKGLKKHKCNICHKLFGDKSALNSHLPAHSDERRFQCQVCDYTAKTSMTLISHNMDRHSINLAKNPRNPHRKPERKPKSSYSQDKFTTCEYCGKQIRKINYYSHIRTHTGEKPYKCKICTKSFSSNVTLRIHTYIHTGKYPYNCKVCDRKFRQKQHLNCHTLTHTGEKPHQCTICNKTFAIRVNLKAHIRQHTGEKPYQCTECYSQFIDLNALKRHTKKYHT